MCTRPVAGDRATRWLDSSLHHDWATTTAVVSGALTVTPTYFVE